MDIDVVNVNGNFFRGAEKESKPSMGRVRENVSGINELMNWGENQNGTAYIDNLDYEREINKHHVASVIIDGQEILVTAPPEQLAHKLHETMVLREMLNESETDNVPVRFHYEKDIRDVSAMFYGYKDLYDRQELLDRVYTALTEKDGSILEREGFNFESYLRLILEDSRKYMNLYEGDKTFSELSSFFARIK